MHARKWSLWRRAFQLTDAARLQEVSGNFLSPRLLLCKEIQEAPEKQSLSPQLPILRISLHKCSPGKVTPWIRTSRLINLIQRWRMHSDILKFLSRSWNDSWPKLNERENEGHFLKAYQTKKSLIIKNHLKEKALEKKTLRPFAPARECVTQKMQGGYERIVWFI